MINKRTDLNKSTRKNKKHLLASWWARSERVRDIAIQHFIMDICIHKIDIRVEVSCQVLSGTGITITPPVIAKDFCLLSVVLGARKKIRNPDQKEILLLKLKRYDVTFSVRKKNFLTFSISLHNEPSSIHHFFNVQQSLLLRRVI